MHRLRGVVPPLRVVQPGAAARTDAVTQTWNDEKARTGRAAGRSRFSSLFYVAAIAANDHGAFGCRAESIGAAFRRQGAGTPTCRKSGEVTFHQTVLDALDKTLIPNAQNAGLEALLEQVRPHIAGHLERARPIQSTIGAAP